VVACYHCRAAPELAAADLGAVLTAMYDAGSPAVE
jgi:hypothetical protein